MSGSGTGGKSFRDLPPELHMRMVSKLDANSMRRLRTTSTYMRDIVEEVERKTHTVQIHDTYQKLRAGSERRYDPFIGQYTHTFSAPEKQQLRTRIQTMKQQRENYLRHMDWWEER